MLHICVAKVNMRVAVLDQRCVIIALLQVVTTYICTCINQNCTRLIGQSRTIEYIGVSLPF